MSWLNASWGHLGRTERTPRPLPGEDELFLEDTDGGSPFGTEQGAMGEVMVAYPHSARRPSGMYSPGRQIIPADPESDTDGRGMSAVISIPRTRCCGGWPMELALIGVASGVHWVLYAGWMIALWRRSPTDDFIKVPSTACSVREAAFDSSTTSCAGWTGCEHGHDLKHGQDCTGRSGCSCFDRWAYLVEINATKGTKARALKGFVSRSRDIGHYCPAQGDCGCTHSASKVDSDFPVGAIECWLPTSGAVPVSSYGHWPFSYTCSLCEGGSCSATTCLKLDEPADELTGVRRLAITGVVCTAIFSGFGLWLYLRPKRNWHGRLRRTLEWVGITLAFFLIGPAFIMMLTIWIVAAKNHNKWQW
eukprot:TRINITY_DN46684_c0_g1_i1.p1 TRINITY_DN46684_c0_g1~~TRINITY_DN46684_c0_g1_i1.p1  ORF type:complete len:362 (+),score=27.10 TRINITY_DN46684_c0_g1_i1:158-1243(+)